MFWLRRVILVIYFLSLGFGAQAQEVSKEQIKGLDEQVQEIKSDVLGIAAELGQLEEQLLYPSHTQVAIFISLAAGENFRLDTVEIRLADRPVARHLYTFKELEALQKGGVQRIYTGNIRSGEHDLRIAVAGQSADGENWRAEQRLKIQKEVGPKMIEFSLSEKGISLKDW